jgi:acetylornithine deacetylase/succinyl-diaminopimelate desuccinylase-like protein
MSRRRRYSQEFKQEAVELTRDPAVSISQIARDLGLNATMLGRWCREAEQEQGTAFTGAGTPRDKELAELRRELVVALNDDSGDTKVTCGCLTIPQSSRNVIPGEVELTVDLRHVEEDQLDVLEQRFEEELAACGQAYGVTTDAERIWKSPVVNFDANCVNAVEAATRVRGFSYRRILSGAGHDSVYVSRVAPTAMIFIPCRDGISHNEAEYATPEHCGQGCQVLADTLVAKASK